MTVLRTRDPDVTSADLHRVVTEFEEHFRHLPPYDTHLRWWIARYSRGDAIAALRADFPKVVDQVEREGRTARERDGAGALLFSFGPGQVGRYRYGLVLLSIALCLRQPGSTDALLRWCQRGDPLVERLAQAGGAPPVEHRVPPPFPAQFDGLYAALEATPTAAVGILRDYVAVWCDQRMEGMGFKLSQRHIGYWCFEAAGLVAAQGIDDRAFAAQPHYPADLVAFYRGTHDAQ
jgi:hypothetical protein